MTRIKISHFNKLTARNTSKNKHFCPHFVDNNITTGTFTHLCRNSIIPFLLDACSVAFPALPHSSLCILFHIACNSPLAILSAMRLQYLCAFSLHYKTVRFRSLPPPLYHLKGARARFGGGAHRRRAANCFTQDRNFRLLSARIKSWRRFGHRMANACNPALPPPALGE